MDNTENWQDMINKTKKNKTKTHIVNINQSKKVFTVIFYYIFDIKPHFFKTLFQGEFLFDFDKFLPTKARIYLAFCDYFKIV
jgi:hypothetical protein